MATVIHVDATRASAPHTRNYLSVMVEHALNRGQEVHVIDETGVLSRDTFTDKAPGVGPGVLTVMAYPYQAARDDAIERHGPAVDLIIVIRKHPVPPFRALEAIFTAAQRVSNRVTSVVDYHKSLGHRITEAGGDSEAVLELARKLINPGTP